MGGNKKKKFVKKSELLAINFHSKKNRVFNRKQKIKMKELKSIAYKDSKSMKIIEQK